MVSKENFLLKEIPNLHPRSSQYKDFWKAEKRKCIEGYWVSGRYMPGNIYFYVNFWHILKNKDNYSKVKVIALPDLRDIEWIKGYMFMEARGFSGFVEDNEITCCRDVKKIEDGLDNKTLEPDDYLAALKYLPKECFTPTNTLKKYEEARTYLPKNHGVNKGKPLYQNEALDVIDLECRRVGKSYFAAGGIIAPNFLFDGATDYDDYLEAIKIGNPMSSETLVGAIDSKYSNDLLRKFMLGLSHIKGAYKVGTTNFPSPLAKKTSGTLSPNDSIVSRYMDSDGDWRGSQSKLHHRSFRDNPFAGNGTGPSITCLEEIGFMENVREAKGALKDVTSNGTQKFGSIFMFGTGGAMAQGATQAAQEIFLNPEEYDCIAFPDFYENSGKKIGFFIPYHLGLNQFKDKEGVTDVVEAKKWVEKKRVRLRAGKSKKPYNDELQNNPEVPSEIFLLTNSNIFPVADLSDHLKSLEASLSGFTSGQLGKLVLSPANVRGIKWEPDLKNELKVCDYPMGKQDDSTGAVQIWEHPPIEDIPYGMYIAGTDPYDQDKSESSSSLGSTFIYKVGDFRQGGIRDMIVAEYTARPDTASDHHEIVRRLLLYYNATDLYENERNSMKMHFEHKNSLYLLANTPTILKATEGSKVDRHYGTHMTAAIKSELEIYARDWLLEPAGNGLLNLHKIYSKSLLKELIAYNNLGNFDRVIAFLLTICLKLQNFRVLIEDKKKEIAQDSFFNRQLFK